MEKSLHPNADKTKSQILNEATIDGILFRLVFALQCAVILCYQILYNTNHGVREDDLWRRP